MKYISITLNGFKRFMLGGIDKFHMDIKESLQLILGSNGSGKSSLVDQLTPLPAHPSDFTKTGSKVIVIEHNENTYTLSSYFSPSQKHSFKKNDLELNDGGTISIQRELVKEHFKITTEIHELITGKEHFHSMSPSRRKEWFIRVCDTDYDYAIRVYNKLRERHRDTTGALKLLKKRLTVESEKTVSTEEENKIMSEINEYHRVLNILLEHRQPLENDLELLSLEQQNLDTELFNISKQLEGAFKQAGNDITGVEDIDKRLSDIELITFSDQIQYNKLSEVHDANDKKINILKQAEQQTIQELETKLLNKQSELTNLQHSTLVNLTTNAEDCFRMFESIKQNLSDLFMTVPENKDRKYSQELLTIARQKLSELNASKNNVLLDLNIRKVKLTHMSEHKDKPDLSCPNCKHRFSLNYNEDEFTKITKLVEDIEFNVLVNLDKQIATQELYINECSNYAMLFRQYRDIVNSFKELNSYWEYLSEKKVITDNPISGSIELNLIYQDLLKQINIQTLSKEIQSVVSILKDLKDIGDTSLNTLVEQNTLIEQNLVSIQEDGNKLKLERESLTSRKKAILSVKSFHLKLEECIQSKKEINKQELETIRRMHLNDTIRTLQSSLAVDEYLLQNMTLQKSIVDDITKQIVELEKQEESLSLLVTQLSPTDGLIAEGLLGFIKNFVMQMNHFIKKIWSYQLELQSCSLDETNSVDLDYKFPMLVGDENIVSDVNKGSTGMLEIVNLAFRVTAMQYLGLKRYPLSLDEFGSSFDMVHRSQATIAIKALIDQQMFSQLYLVSHYEATFGALSNPQICVLDSTNITVPKLGDLVNKYVKIN